VLERPEAAFMEDDTVEKNKTFVAVLAPLFLLLLTSIFFFGINADEPSAFEIDFDRDPLWVVSGTWDQDGDRLLLVDNARQEILPIMIDDGARPAISPSLTGTGFSRFNLIHNSSGRLHVDLDSAGLAVLDASLDISPQSVTKLVRDDFSSNRMDHRIAAIHAWTVLDRYVIAFADIEQQRAPRWVSGFLRIPIDHPEKFSYLIDLKLSLGDQMVTYYQLGLKLMDASDTSAFVLVMDDPPYLVIIDISGGTRTVNVQTACGGRPEIPRITGVTTLPTALQALERAEGPIGVHTQDNKVFLLCRRWVGRGVQFSVAEVDIDTGAAIFLNPIDTNASHLVAIPGPRYWAFVQKGPVSTTKSGGPFMKIGSTLMVPTKAVVDPRLRSSRTAGNSGGGNWRLLGRVWKWFEFAFSGIGIILVSLLFRKTRALWRRAASRVNSSFIDGLHRLINHLRRRERSASIDSIDSEQGSK
jgi:hypothetical protein